MNKLLWSLMLLAIFVASPALAAGVDEEEKDLGLWVEAQGVSGGRPARAIVWFERDVTETFGFFAFLWKESDGYHEIIAGPTWKPFDGAQVGCGIGRETMRGEGSGSRRSCFAEVTLGKVNLYLAAERGGFSGPWKKMTATYALSERLGFGVMHETDLGTGPRLEWNVRKDIQVWGAILKGRVLNDDDIFQQKWTAMVGINKSF